MPTVPLRWRICIYVSAIIVLLLYLQTSATRSRAVTRALFTGWLDFIRQVLPAVRLHWPSIITGAVAAIILLVGLHLLASWFIRGPADAPAGTGRVWKFRWTVGLVGLGVLLFTAGIVVVGMVHQVTWIASDIAADRAFGSRVTGGGRW